jgi:hypothetical protein
MCAAEGGAEEGTGSHAGRPLRGSVRRAEVASRQGRADTQVCPYRALVSVPRMPWQGRSAPFPPLAGERAGERGNPRGSTPGGGALYGFGFAGSVRPVRAAWAAAGSVTSP